MEIKLNHSDLSALLAKEAGISVSKAEVFTKALFDIIIEGLESDGIVKINGFGTFKITDVASRSSVNVNTGEKFEIKGHKKLSFIPADSLKDDVNQPFAMFEPVEVDETYKDDEPVDAADGTEENETIELEQPEITVEESGEPDAPNVVADVVAEQEATAEPEPIAENIAEKVEEKPAVVQERPAEPVLVRVPKKVNKTPVVEEKKKKNFAWLYMTLFILVAVAAVFYFYPASEQANQKAHVAEAVKTENNSLSAETADAVTAATVVDATTAATPQNKELAGVEQPVADIVHVREAENCKEYEFVMIDELKSLPLENITLADTHLYEVTGEWAQHKVAAGETLTRIALKYYGDKKLWPYIVKHNSMSRPDNLRKGMLISIPKLEPKK